jgi:hypothetical protein
MLDGEVVLEPQLVTAFHLGLVDRPWLEKLVSYLASQPELAGKGLRGPVRSNHNEDKYMGPNSVVKCRFELPLEWQLGEDSPVIVTYTFGVEYKPTSDDFKTISKAMEYRWRDGSNLENLDERLLSLGVLREEDLDPLQVDFDVTTVGRGKTAAYEHSILPIERIGDRIRVAVPKASVLPALPTVCYWPRNTILEPVLVRDEVALSEVAHRLFGKRVQVEEATLKEYSLPPDFNEITEAEWKQLLEASEMNPYFDARYLVAWRGILAIRFLEDAIFVSASLFQDHQVWLSGKPVDGIWQRLQHKAEDNRVWTPAVKRVGLDGCTWTLTRHAGGEETQVYQWFPPVSPFLEFCFDLLRLAGFEIQIEYWSHWDDEW